MGVSALPPSLIDLLKFNRGFHLERLQLLPPIPHSYLGYPHRGPLFLLNTAVTQMSSAAGERREVVIFSPTQLAEGFSAFPLNGRETSACGNGELGLLCASQTKEASELGPVVSQTRAGGGS